MTKEEKLAELLRESQTQFGFSPEKTKQILKDHRYSVFKETMFDVYMMCLRHEWLNLDEQFYLREKEKEEKEKKGVYQPVPCPVCGSPTVGDLHWYGRRTKKKGWQCSKAGIRHFLWVKANECREEQGLQPIPWENFDAVYKADFVVQSVAKP